MNKTLVAYFSQTGNTKAVAEAIFAALEGDKDIQPIGDDLVARRLRPGLRRLPRPKPQRPLPGRGLPPARPGRQEDRPVLHPRLPARPPAVAGSAGVRPRLRRAGQGPGHVRLPGQDLACRLSKSCREVPRAPGMGRHGRFGRHAPRRQGPGTRRGFRPQDLDGAFHPRLLSRLSPPPAAPPLKEARHERPAVIRLAPPVFAGAWILVLRPPAPPPKPVARSRSTTSSASPRSASTTSRPTAAGWPARSAPRPTACLRTIPVTATRPTSPRPRSDLIVLDAVDRRADPPLPRKEQIRSVAWSPDGKRLAVLLYRKPAFELADLEPRTRGNSSRPTLQHPKEIAGQFAPPLDAGRDPAPASP